jgi:ABC-2 type transport system ATP-binding protein
MQTLQIDALTKRFRQLANARELLAAPRRRQERTALDALSFEVSEGELFGVLGENGAGKTTLIRILATALLPTSGSARVDGYDVVEASGHVRERIGLVSSEERSFYWRLTGRQNLEFFAALVHLPRDRARRRIDELLDAIQIGEVADQPFRTYSTGTRHRFSIARGLLTDPRVLLLDEPTRSLDPLAADAVRALIRDRLVRDEGRTGLIATHSLAEAEAICDRIAIIRRGRLVASGTVDELSRSVGLGSVAAVVVDGASSAFTDAVADVAGVLSAESVEGAASKVIVRLDARDGVLDSLLRGAIAAGGTIESCVTIGPTLEDVYRRVLTDEELAEPSIDDERRAPA